MCQKKKDKIRTLHILEIIFIVLSVICLIVEIVIAGNRNFDRKIYVGTRLLGNISAGAFIASFFVVGVIKLRQKMITDIDSLKEIRMLENIIIAFTCLVYLFDTILDGLYISNRFDYGLLIAFNGFILYSILIRIELCKIREERLLSVRNLVGMILGGTIVLFFCIVVVCSWLNKIGVL